MISQVQSSLLYSHLLVLYRCMFVSIHKPNIPADGFACTLYNTNLLTPKSRHSSDSTRFVKNKMAAHIGNSRWRHQKHGCPNWESKMASRLVSVEPLIAPPNTMVVLQDGLQDGHLIKHENLNFKLATRLAEQDETYNNA